MAANSTLAVANVNFDDIKQSLKNYLSSQANFKDFDFTGSNLNTMLDILAYNTYLQNFYLNMVASEGFIDSAQLRNSVVSHAKTLGYETSSTRAPVATVNINLTTTANTKTMSAGTTFTTTINGEDYQFVTIEDKTSSNTGSVVSFDGVQPPIGSLLGAFYINDSGELACAGYQEWSGTQLAIALWASEAGLVRVRVWLKQY